RQQYNSEPRTF
nr:immunoglobulin light chain junction region [Macaca mulatta]